MGNVPKVLNQPSSSFNYMRKIHELFLIAQFTEIVSAPLPSKSFWHPFIKPFLMTFSPTHIYITKLPFIFRETFKWNYIKKIYSDLL